MKALSHVKDVFFYLKYITYESINIVNIQILCIHVQIYSFVSLAASEAGIGFTLSTIATTSIGEVAEHVPNGLRFFQLYIYKERDVTLQLLRRAEKNGFKAILLTVDTPFFGKRLADNRNKFTLPPHLK